LPFIAPIHYWNKYSKEILKQPYNYFVAIGAPKGYGMKFNELSQYAISHKLMRL